MADHDPQPEDIADPKEPAAEPAGTLRADISREIVRLYKDHYGKGPVRCRTYLEPETVTVVLGGGYTRSEQTLFEDGKWHEVRGARQICQDSMEEGFVELLEQLPGRQAAAFMSAKRQDPGFAVELVIL